MLNSYNLSQVGDYSLSSDDKGNNLINIASTNKNPFFTSAQGGTIYNGMNGGGDDSDIISKKRQENTQQIMASQKKDYYGFDANKVNSTFEKFHTIHNGLLEDDNDDDDDIFDSGGGGGISSTSFKPPPMGESIGSIRREKMENMQINAGIGRPQININPSSTSTTSTSTQSTYNQSPKQRVQQAQKTPPPLLTKIPQPMSKSMDINNITENYRGYNMGGGGGGGALPNFIFPSQLAGNPNMENPYGKHLSQGRGQMDGFSNNDLLMKKINYMIHLLEENKDEKTNNITEEVILYSFLGVFMIFLVDSFSKVGKYVR